MSIFRVVCRDYFLHIAIFVTSYYFITLPLIPLICLAAPIQQPGHHAVSTVEPSCHGPGCCRFLVEMVGPGF